MYKLEPTAAVVRVVITGFAALSFQTEANANELLRFDEFAAANDWIVVAPGTVEFGATTHLRFYDDTDSNNSVHLNTIDVPDSYIVSLDAIIDQYPATNKDALGIRIRDGDHKLEIKFRNGALHALKDNGAGGLSLVSILSSVDTSSHTYRAEVNDGEAKVYQDGTLLDSFTMPSDTASDIIYFWSRGVTGDPSEAQITSLNLIDTHTELFSSPANFSVFDALPASTVASGSGTFSITDTYSPSVTSWTADNLDPTNVWQQTIAHDNSDATRDWEIRIGRGGQIYSLRTSAGELVPPQEHKGAEWIDEVFQAVTVNTLTNNRDPNAYPSRSFAHQAGIYWLKKYQGVEEELDPTYLDHSWYSPMLAARGDLADKSYATLVWPQYSHVPTIYESNQIIYTKIRDLGDGVIELTYVITNSGDEDINWLNVPWGGVRTSSLGKQFLSNSDGTYTEHDRKFGKQSIPAESDDMGLFNHEDTGGWFAWANGTSATADALGIVFGLDENFDATGPDYHWNRSHFKWGWTNSTRDYNVGVNIIPANIKPGQTFYYRTYLVVGTLSHVASKGNALKDDVEYGLLNMDESSAATTDLVEKAITRDGVTQTVIAETTGTRDLAVFTDPVNDSVPVFLMEKNNGQLFISDDPRELSTFLSYTNPYQSFLDEGWSSLAGWTQNVNGGVVEISPSGQLRMEETAAGTTNSVYRTDIDLPSTFRLRFRAKIDSFGTTPATPLGVRLRNGVAKLELFFRDGDLRIRDTDGTSLTTIRENIPAGEWHTYEFAVKYNGLQDTYRSEFSFDGEPYMNTDDGVNAVGAFGIPKDSGSDLVYLWNTSTITTAESHVDWLQVEDTFFEQLTGREQNRPYDSYTRYRGFLGYAMPASHSSTSITYQSLDSVLSDNSYYPNPASKTLKVID